MIHHLHKELKDRYTHRMYDISKHTAYKPVSVSVIRFSFVLGMENISIKYFEYWYEKMQIFLYV